MTVMQTEEQYKQLLDKQKLGAPLKSTVDKFQLLPEFLKVRGLVKQHLNSFNYFVNSGIKKIVRTNDRIVLGIDPSIFLRFKYVRIGQPSVTEDGASEKLNPHMSRPFDMTYAAPILFNIEYIQGSHAEKTVMEKGTSDGVNDVVTGRMPVMLQSCCCVLHGKDETELSRLGECPLDPGGYFIIEGTEKLIL